MEHRQPNTLKACENHGHISSALLARHHRSATRASAPVMGNSAAQVCCCERRPENPNRRRGEGQPRSPHLQVSQAQSKSSSSSWPFDFDSFGEAQEEPKKAPLAQQAADEAEQKVKILEISALKVMGKLRKFPTSGMGWGSGWSAKERFFAALPTKAQLKPSSKKEVTHQFVYEIEQGGAGSRGSIDRLKCWRSGSLQYWDSQAAFEKKEPPKGSIPLLGITRVYIDEQNKNEVVVKYANGAASEPVLLRLHFPSHMTAEQWRKELRQIRATL
eukprot:s2644_g7.t1